MKNVYTKKDYLIPAGLILFCFMPVIAGIYRVFSIASGGQITPENQRFFAAPIPAVIHIIIPCLFKF